MLSMGAGDHSTARVYEHIERIMRCFSTLSGWQQGATEAEGDFSEEAVETLKKLAKDLGYTITIQRNIEK